jgi:hypothetical protein
MDKAYYVDSIKYKIDDISSNLEYSDYSGGAGNTAIDRDTCMHAIHSEILFR